MPTTVLGCATSRTVAVSAPVPQPTSSHRWFSATPSHGTNRRATCRLHRPMKGSYSPPRPLPSAAQSSREMAAARLQWVQRRRAQDAAEEAEFIVRLAELSPGDDDPPPDRPGARSESWRSDPEFPGVSEFFAQELAM